MAAVLPRELRVLLFRHRRVLRAVAIAVAVVLALGILKPGARGGVRVLVAAHDLAAGTPLAKTDFAVKTFPADLLPQGYLRPGAAAVNRVITGAARAGEVLTDVRLLDDALTIGHPGLAARSVLLDQASLAGVKAGCHVTLFAPVGDRLADDVLVLDVPPASTDASSDAGAAVTLAVTAGLGDRIAKAASDGGRFSVQIVG